MSVTIISNVRAMPLFIERQGPVFSQSTFPNNIQKMINIRHLLNKMKLESSQFIDYPKRTELLFA